MDLSINGQPILREQYAPYEWGRPNGGDSQLRNLQPVAITLKRQYRFMWMAMTMDTITEIITETTILILLPS